MDEQTSTVVLAAGSEASMKAGQVYIQRPSLMSTWRLRILQTETDHSTARVDLVRRDDIPLSLRAYEEGHGLADLVGSWAWREDTERLPECPTHPQRGACLCLLP